MDSNSGQLGGWNKAGLAKDKGRFIIGPNGINTPFKFPRLNSAGLIVLVLASLLTLALLDMMSCGGGSSLSIPQITNTSLPNGIEGSNYHVDLTAKGGTPPYSGVISAGRLPAGLSLNSGTGAIDGVPAAPGVSTFTIKITDNAGSWSTLTMSITIFPRSIPPSISFNPTSPLNPAQVGQFYQFHFGTANPPSGGHPPYSFYLGSGVGFPPFGLNLDINGLLSGTPQAEGARAFEVCAKDLDGNYKCGLTQLTVIASPKINEVFRGSFSGVFQNSNSSIGCRWANSFSGTISLTLTKNSDGTVSGTGECQTNVIAKTIFTPSNTTCNSGNPLHPSTGPISGTDSNLNGKFTGTEERPVIIGFSGTRRSNTITGSFSITKQMMITVNGEFDNYTSLSATVSNIVLTKQ